MTLHNTRHNDSFRDGVQKLPLLHYAEDLVPIFTFINACGSIAPYSIANMTEYKLQSNRTEDFNLICILG